MVRYFLLSLALHETRLMVEFKLSDIKETKPIELGVRFLFGGLCTVGAGLIATRYGPAIGRTLSRISGDFPGECHPYLYLAFEMWGHPPSREAFHFSRGEPSTSARFAACRSSPGSCRCSNMHHRLGS